MGEAGAESLDAPAFMIHADRQRRLAQPLDLLAQRRQLLGRFVVAAEKDHAARGRVREAPPVVIGQRQPYYVDHRRAGRQPYFSHSRITVAKATPLSSERDRWEEVTPLLSRRDRRAAEYSRTGLPDGRFFTHTPCQLAGWRIPVPKALVKASLAAKRLAR